MDNPYPGMANYPQSDGGAQNSYYAAQLYQQLQQLIGPARALQLFQPQPTQTPAIQPINAGRQGAPPPAVQQPLGAQFAYGQAAQ